ncbi:MAG: Rpn family recombination-promoting nuclease/putative transposase [Bacteroidota bacterium]
MEKKERYINPFTDFGFKKLFGTEFNKDLLIDFLNQILADKDQISDLTFENTENQGRRKDSRKSFFDLKCKSTAGETFIVELQNTHQEFFKDRSLFYASFPIQDQAPQSKYWDYELTAVYTICILNFAFKDQDGLDRYLREIKLMDVQTHEPFYDKLTFIYLEVPRFRLSIDKLTTQKEKWMYVIQNLAKLQERPKELQDKIFKKFFEQAEIANLTKEEMNRYDESLKEYNDQYSILKTAKLDGKREVALEMKKNGYKLKEISKMTGLSVEVIESL